MEREKYIIFSKDEIPLFGDGPHGPYNTNSHIKGVRIVYKNEGVDDIWNCPVVYPKPQPIYYLSVCPKQFGISHPIFIEKKYLFSIKKGNLKSGDVSIKANPELEILKKTEKSV